MATQKDSCRFPCADGWVKKNWLLLLTIAAIIAGIVIGLCLRLTSVPYDGIIWLSIWGELFLRMLKMIILPLIVCCLIIGISGAEGRAVGKLGLATLVYVYSTQLVSVIVGVALVVSIKPGQILSSHLPLADKSTSLTDVAADFLRNLFPDNIIQACIEHAYTEANHTDMAINASQVNAELVYRKGTNIMGVLVFSILLGVGIHAGGVKAKPLLSLFESLNVVIFKILDIILLYSPLGIFSLIAGALVKVNNLEDALQSLGMYIVVVIVGLALHQLILLPLIYLLLTRKNPFKLLLQVLDAILAGMAAPSDSVALPYLLRRCDTTLGIDTRVSKFTLAILTTINRDGSALFIAVASVFVAQTYGVTLGAGQYIVLILLVTLLSAAVAGVPSSSIIIIIMVTSAFGIPMEERLGLMMTTEWLLDRLRTCTNLCSTSFGVSIIAHYCTKYLHDDVNISGDNDKENGGASTNKCPAVASDTIQLSESLTVL